MNILERFLGVFASPKKTLEAIAEKPVWVDALIILLVVLAIHTYIITPIMQTETLGMFRDNVKLQERLGKDRFEQYIKSQENPSPSRRLVNSLAITPVTSAVGFLISSLFLLIFGRIVSTTGTFKAVLAVFLHANFIDKILGNAVRLAIIIPRKSIFQTTTSLALFFPKMSFTSPAYIILSQVDFFQLWMFGVIGYGLAAVFKIELKKAMVVSYAFFVIKSAIYIALGFLSRSFLG
jgi:hypothetical protein